MENRALAGRYALGKRVGAGGMADVFRARDLRLDREVAVKLFRPGTADGLERGSAEARLLAGLDHPGLVRVLDMDNGLGNGERPDDGAYLVMELVPGPDLGVLLRTGGALGREEVRLMALDLARTLQYIHGRGIVHRDVKPSNILTRDADPHSGLFRYLLTDFGIARFFDGGRMTATGQVIGSAAYFSPEQARGDGVGQPSDIYSLGLVMIEALTGERAFPGTGIESALARLHRSPSIPHAAGPALSALLISMTLDEPADRPDAASVVRALTGTGPQQAGTDPATAAQPVPAPTTAALPVPAPATAALPVPVEAQPVTVAGVGRAVASDDRAVRWSGPETTVLPHPAPIPGTTAFPSSSDTESTGGGPPGRTGRTLDTGDGGADAIRNPDDSDGDGAGSAQPTRVRPVASRGRRHRVLPWLIAVLAIGLLAAALWTFGALSGMGPAPVIEPLPAVQGEPGERLQELYESVQP